MKKIVLLAFVLMLLSTTMVVRFVSPVVSYPARTELLMEVDLPVHNIDSGKNFSTIQGAINDNETLDGHTILVDAETYYENAVVNKTVSLVGENPSTTVINGGGIGDVVYVTADNVTIRNFTIRNSGSYYAPPDSGIRVEACYCNITDNIIIDNSVGIYLYESSHNTLYSNNVTNKYDGIILHDSSNNVISGNNVTAHEYIGVTLLWLSSNNVISGNNIKNNGRGISCGSSSNNIVSGNNIAANSPNEGIFLIYSSNNNISRNNIIANNASGICVISSSNNNIYHNNFVDNTEQVDSYDSTNVWDSGYPCGGNYWSDYNETDLFSGPYQNEAGSDGIGDTAYTIDGANQDRYALMGPISFFNAGTWNKVTYYVHTVSNSTVSDFYFSRDDKLVSFNVNGTSDTIGFCRVTIPRELMWCDSLDEWNVTVNDNPPTYLKAMEAADYTYLYFTYNHSMQEVQIKGIYAIPEFPTWVSILLILIVLTVAITIYKRRLLKTPIH